MSTDENLLGARDQSFDPVVSNLLHDGCHEASPTSPQRSGQPFEAMPNSPKDC